MSPCTHLRPLGSSQAEALCGGAGGHSCSQEWGETHKARKKRNLLVGPLANKVCERS